MGLNQKTNYKNNEVLNDYDVNNINKALNSLEIQNIDGDDKKIRLIGKTFNQKESPASENPEVLGVTLDANLYWDDITPTQGGTEQ